MPEYSDTENFFRRSTPTRRKKREGGRLRGAGGTNPVGDGSTRRAGGAGGFAGPSGPQETFFFFFFFFFRRAGVLWHGGKIKKSFVRVLWRGYQRANPGTRVLSHGDSTVSDPKIAARRFIHGLLLSCRLEYV